MMEKPSPGISKKKNKVKKNKNVISRSKGVSFNEDDEYFYENSSPNKFTVDQPLVITAISHESNPFYSKKVPSQSIPINAQLPSQQQQKMLQSAPVNRDEKMSKEKMENDEKQSIEEINEQDGLLSAVAQKESEQIQIVEIMEIMDNDVMETGKLTTKQTKKKKKKQKIGKFIYQANFQGQVSNISQDQILTEKESNPFVSEQINKERNDAVPQIMKKELKNLMELIPQKQEEASQQISKFDDQTQILRDQKHLNIDDNVVYTQEIEEFENELKNQVKVKGNKEEKNRTKKKKIEKIKVLGEKADQMKIDELVIQQSTLRDQENQMQEVATNQEQTTLQTISKKSSQDVIIDNGIKKRLDNKAQIQNVVETSNKIKQGFLEEQRIKEGRERQNKSQLFKASSQNYEESRFQEKQEDIQTSQIPKQVQSNSLQNIEIVTYLLQDDFKNSLQPQKKNFTTSKKKKQKNKKSAKSEFSRQQNKLTSHIQINEGIILNTSEVEVPNDTDLIKTDPNSVQEKTIVEEIIEKQEDLKQKYGQFTAEGNIDECDLEQLKNDVQKSECIAVVSQDEKPKDNEDNFQTQPIPPSEHALPQTIERKQEQRQNYDKQYHEKVVLLQNQISPKQCSSTEKKVLENLIQIRQEAEESWSQMHRLDRSYNSKLSDLRKQIEEANQEMLKLSRTNTKTDMNEVGLGRYQRIIDEYLKNKAMQKKHGQKFDKF